MNYIITLLAFFAISCSDSDPASAPIDPTPSPTPSPPVTIENCAYSNFSKDEIELWLRTAKNSWDQIQDIRNDSNPNVRVALFGAAIGAAFYEVWGPSVEPDIESLLYLYDYLQIELEWIAIDKEVVNDVHSCNF